MYRWHRVFCFPYTLVYITEIFQSTWKTGYVEEGYVELNIDRSYCKLTLKASEHIPLGNNHASNSRVCFLLLCQL